MLRHSRIWQTFGRFLDRLEDVPHVDIIEAQALLEMRRLVVAATVHGIPDPLQRVVLARASHGVAVDYIHDLGGSSGPRLHPVQRHRLRAKDTEPRRSSGHPRRIGRGCLDDPK